MMGNCVMTMII